MSELISEELFDQFRSSEWPRMFSFMAQLANEEGMPVEDTRAFSISQSGLTIVPEEERKMLEDMGIIRDEVVIRNVGYPTVNPDYDYRPRHHDSPHVWHPRFTDFGTQLVTACENLYTPEEHKAAAEAARPELEKSIAHMNAMLGLE